MPGNTQDELQVLIRPKTGIVRSDLQLFAETGIFIASKIHWLIMPVPGKRVPVSGVIFNLTTSILKLNITLIRSFRILFRI